MQLECEIRKLRKNNLLESSANQGKTTEKKLSEKKKINKQLKGKSYSTGIMMWQKIWHENVRYGKNQ